MLYTHKRRRMLSVLGFLVGCLCFFQFRFFRIRFIVPRRGSCCWIIGLSMMVESVVFIRFTVIIFFFFFLVNGTCMALNGRWSDRTNDWGENLVVVFFLLWEKIGVKARSKGWGEVGRRAGALTRYSSNVRPDPWTGNQRLHRSRIL